MALVLQRPRSIAIREAMPRRTRFHPQQYIMAYVGVMHLHLQLIKNWPELANQANWRAGRLAKICKVSPRTLERFIIRKYKKTPKAWLIELRQKIAAEELARGMWPKEVATIAAYKSHAQFSREFKAYWGYSPSQHIRNLA